MKPITRYEAEDGWVFTTEQECVEHENSVKAHAAKSKIPGRTFKVALLCAAIGVIVAHKTRKRHDYYAHSSFPPGLTLACDGAGHYAPRYAQSGYTFGTPSKNRQDAINEAWGQYEYEIGAAKRAAVTKPKPEVVWVDCNQ